ncbi:MAG: aminodeoxychorismate/anthranilate synthase component II [Deltaproteobacteria bacterium]|nr:aminodeoxychorismate/anthranilate synthase component II [Deltaproteobacteria bacterium]
MKTLILDNYDSFAYNLYQLVGELGGEPQVIRNDALDLEAIRRAAPERIIISPGPGTPEEPSSFGVGREVILNLGPERPTLGVCLGHQGIVWAFGGRIIRAPEVRHGKASVVHHEGDALFEGVPRRFEAMRYHSLVADPGAIPSCLSVTAWTSDGVVMAVRHRRFPIVGVQFHPESIGTPAGRTVLRNFLSMSAPRR